MPILYFKPSKLNCNLPLLSLCSFYLLDYGFCRCLEFFRFMILKGIRNGVENTWLRVIIDGSVKDTV
jgi:hypothetical protein